MKQYTDYLARAKAKHGARFSAESLNPDFIRFYESGERVKVKTSWGHGFGTIGITTGWKPCFLLMHSIRSMGSSFIIGMDHKVIMVKRGNKYTYCI
jgi:hypothetical protein